MAMAEQEMLAAYQTYEGVWGLLYVGTIATGIGVIVVVLLSSA